MKKTNKTSQASHSPKSDEKIMTDLFNKYGLVDEIFHVSENPEYIYDEAKRKGAVIMYNVRNSLDFCFDKSGKYLGSHTGSMSGWKPCKRPTKKPKKLS